jgi:glyoxylase-like metal-dependent hydrolase (beta-lactamase superfamily II)/rhodanese-related sulfurtransferase
MDVITIETPSLGDRSYIVHDGTAALVVDPQRDVDRVLAAAEQAGVAITHIAETHVHNDYVSGGLTLSRLTGARYLHAAAEPLRFDHVGVGDGDVVEVGALRVEVVHTPGHTPHHLTYLVIDTSDPDGAPAAFTGGSILYGTVGRTDLIAPEATDELSRAQYRSANHLADRLPDDARLYPTHGFGSFCASAQSEGASDGTMGVERRVNVALTAPDENAFVDQLVAGLDAYPRYYAHMGPLNQAGGVAVDLSRPAEVDPVELARRIHRGEWVVDLRPRRQFAASHVAGTIGVELGLSFSTYLAWLLPWGMPITLLADSIEDIAEAQRQLVRVGIDRPAGAATGDPDSWAPDADRSHYGVVDFAALIDEADLPILDVRLEGQYKDGHVVGAINVPLHELLGRLEDVPSGPVAVHCQSGYRASIAASLLDRAGHDVILVDDDYDNAPDSGRPVVTP